MKTVDTIIFPKWIIPVEPTAVVLEEHALVIEQGRILDIVPEQQIKEGYQAKEKIELPEHVLMPGFINAHAHSPMSLLRGLADDLPLMEWLYQYIFPAENRWLSDDFVRAGTRLALAEMIKSGTTCFNEHYTFPECIAEETARCGMRANIGMGLIDQPTPWGKNGLDALNKAVQVYQKLKTLRQITFSFAPHAPYTLSDKTLLEIKKSAVKWGMRLDIHMHETIEEIKQSLETYGKRPLKRFADLGILDVPFQAIHMTQVDREDIELAVRYGIHIVHCPKSNCKLASGISPVQQLLQAGINVALGTDSAVSNNNLDMISELRHAALLGKLISNDPVAIDATTALQMATINGAKALGLENEIGSIKPGKAADLIAINLNHVNTQPAYHPVSQIVYASQRSQISDLWVAGKRLLQQGELTTLDEAGILAEAKTWGQKILLNVPS